jgi:hypothetical protein
MHRNITVFKPLAMAALGAALALTLAGCATVSTVESEVQSFATAPTQVQPGPFQFERLPSQDQDTAQAAALEKMAQAALERRGFSRVDAGARYSVQIGAGTLNQVQTYPEPFFGRFAWRGYGHNRLWRGRLLYGPSWPDRETFITRVRLKIRDLGNGKLVYESAATNELSWSDSGRVLPALFEAALTDFPSPPKGVRKIVVNLKDMAF